MIRQGFNREFAGASKVVQRDASQETDTSRRTKIAKKEEHPTRDTVKNRERTLSRERDNKYKQ